MAQLWAGAGSGAGVDASRGGGGGGSGSRSLLRRALLWGRLLRGRRLGSLGGFLRRFLCRLLRGLLGRFLLGGFLRRVLLRRLLGFLLRGLLRGLLRHQHFFLFVFFAFLVLFPFSHRD